jgi:hypothetical protein
MSQNGVGILAIDIGGSRIKVLASGELEPRKAPSGTAMTPLKMVEIVKELSKDWEYQLVSIGYPGLVGEGGPRAEPGNLGGGWVGFDYTAAFGKPVKFINDAAMQALGCYEGGRMLFLGLGTGLGSTLIADSVVIPLELGQLRLIGKSWIGPKLGRKGLKRSGKTLWRERVIATATNLMEAFLCDYVTLGGGNAELVTTPPYGVRLGHPLAAFRGGFRLWDMHEVPPLPAHDTAPRSLVSNWKLV